MKTCKLCLQSKSLSCFNRHATNSDGLRGNCIDCGKARSIKYHNENKDHLAKKEKEYRANNKEKIKQRLRDKSEHYKLKRKERYLKDKEKIIKQATDWYKENKDKKSAYDRGYVKKNAEKKIKQLSEWRAANKDRVRELNYLRKKRLRQAMLKGVENEILEFYRNRPKGYHIDHIIPLNGSDVSGLHVPWNLQYLPAIENLRKGNKVLT